MTHHAKLYDGSFFYHPSAAAKKCAKPLFLAEKLPLMGLKTIMTVWLFRLGTWLVPAVATLLEVQAQPGHHVEQNPEAVLAPLDAQYKTLEARGDKPSMAKIALQKAEALLRLRRYDEAVETYRANLDFCEKNRLPAEAVESADALAEMYRMRGAYPESLALFRKSLGIYRSRGDRLNESGSLSKVGAVYLQLGQLDSAKVYLENALHLKEQLGDSASIGHPLNFLSLFYERIGDWDKSLHYQLRAVAIKKNLGDSTALPDLLNGVSSIFMSQQNWDKAEEYALQSLQLSEKQNLRFSRTGALIKLANIRLKRGDEAGAIAYHEKSIAILRGSKSGDLPNELLDLARIYLRQKKYEMAHLLIGEADTLARPSRDRGLSAKIALLRGEYYAQQEDWPNAARHLDTALAKARQAGARALEADICRLSSQVAERRGQLRQALGFFKRYAALKDTLSDEARQKSASELETKYRLSEKESAIALLHSANEVQALRLRDARQRQIGLLAALAALGLLAGLGFYLYRLNRASNRRLSEKNALISNALQEKELLLREIHHRVKNNLQVISSLLKLQSDHLTDNQAQRALDEGRNRVQSMALIHQDLYHDDRLPGIQAADYVGKLTGVLFRSYNIRPESIELRTDVEPLLLDVDTAVPIGLILNELISNALKHAFPSGGPGVLEVVLKKNGDERLLLRVRDNGVGADPAKIEAGARTFGMQLVAMLAEKLEAGLHVTADNGTQVDLDIRHFNLIETA